MYAQSHAVHWTQEYEQEGLHIFLSKANESKALFSSTYRKEGIIHIKETLFSSTYIRSKKDQLSYPASTT